MIMIYLIGHILFLTRFCVVATFDSATRVGTRSEKEKEERELEGILLVGHTRNHKPKGALS